MWSPVLDVKGGESAPSSTSVKVGVLTLRSQVWMPVAVKPGTTELMSSCPVCVEPCSGQFVNCLRLRLQRFGS